MVKCDITKNISYIPLKLILENYHPNDSVYKLFEQLLIKFF